MEREGVERDREVGGGDMVRPRPAGRVTDLYVGSEAGEVRRAERPMTLDLIL